MSVCKSCNQTLATYHEMAYTVVTNKMRTDPAHIQVTEFCDNPHCPSKQMPRRDGNLDEEGTVNVCMCDPIYSISGPVAGVYLSERFGPDKIGITPAQALSLLDWLQQEKETLKKLAKEHANEQ